MREKEEQALFLPFDVMQFDNRLHREMRPGAVLPSKDIYFTHAQVIQRVEGVPRVLEFQTVCFTVLRLAQRLAETEWLYCGSYKIDVYLCFQ